MIRRLLICFLLNFSMVKGQLLQGRIEDSSTGEGIPFAAVGMKHHAVSGASNEQGYFDLRVPEGAENDSLMITAFGYHRHIASIASFTPGTRVRLRPVAVQLEEVVVRPQPPEFYIREAMRRIKENYPGDPFSTTAYYRENARENGALIKSDEAVFRTYCPSYLDTTHSHDQLLLYRKADNLAGITFMSREWSKKDTTANRAKADLSGSYGGPESVLKTSRVNIKSWRFLDSTRFRDYRYAFERGTWYDERPLMVISFRSKGKEDHLREEGKIYLDATTLAVVKMENSGDVVIPLVVRSLMFTLGYGATDPVYTRHVEFTFREGRWYPQQVRYSLNVKLIKRYWFAPNDRSFFEIDQVFMVNELRTTKATDIASSNRFDPKKPMDKQVHNDVGLRWEDVNVVK